MPSAPPLLPPPHQQHRCRHWALSTASAFPLQVVLLHAANDVDLELYICQLAGHKGEHVFGTSTALRAIAAAGWAGRVARLFSRRVVHCSPLRAFTALTDVSWCRLVGGLAPLTSLTRLQRLCLHYPHSPYDPGVRGSLETLSRLQSLTFLEIDCDRAPEPPLFDVIAPLHNLANLEVQAKFCQSLPATLTALRCLTRLVVHLNESTSYRCTANTLMSFAPPLLVDQEFYSKHPGVFKAHRHL